MAYIQSLFVPFFLHNLRLFSVFIAVVLTGVPAKAQHGNGPADIRSRVLFISSYHPAFPSFDRQVRGLQAGLREAGFDAHNLLLDIEFMDTKRFNPAERSRNFEAALTQKLGQLLRYDAVVVGDDNAFNFILRVRDRLFANTPVVFLGVNNVDKALRMDRDPLVTGVVEKTSIDETLAAMHRLYPTNPAIHVVVDGTQTGIIQRHDFERAAQAHPEYRIRIHSLGEQSYGELLLFLANQPPSQPVFLSTVYQDNYGTAIEYLDLIAMIRNIYAGPIFASQEHGIGYGIVGGKIISHFRQGHTAARQLARILRGTPPSLIPVIAESPNEFVFDYRELDRLRIAPASLPDGAIVENRPSSFLREQPELIFGGAGFVALQFGIILYLFLTVRRRKRAEGRLRSAMAEANAANQAKTEFLSRMSHELRTPLNGIIGFGQILEADPGRLSAEEIREYSGHIRTGGEHLLTLINEVLDLARVESGASDLELSTFNPVDTARESVNSLQSLAERYDVTVSLRNLPQNAIAVSADQTRFRQVVLNLVSNAIKYNRPGGRVWVDIGMTGGGAVRIAVIDNGVGIPEDRQAEVFEAFNRLGAEYGSAEGTGIGLVISKKFVEMMDGRIGFSSAPGRGSTFWFELPEGETEAAEPEETAAPVPHPHHDAPAVEPGKVHVLYVEDNPTNVKLMQAVLDTCGGYFLESAETAEIGLELARARRPQIIIMDINLPGMSGVEAMARIKDDPVLRDIPVIALSANAMPTDISRAMSEGFRRYLTKPVSIDVIETTLAEVLDPAEAPADSADA